MNKIKIENYSKNIGKNKVLSDINLTLESGIVYGLKGCDKLRVGANDL